MTVEARAHRPDQVDVRQPDRPLDPGQLMTAREIAMLARYIIREYPELYPIFSQKDSTTASTNSTTAIRCSSSKASASTA